MSVRNLAAAGLALTAIGGPLVLVGMAAEDVGVVVLAGVAALWLGLVAVLAALLQLARTEHRMLRTQGEAVRAIATQCERMHAGDPDAVPAALDQRLTTLETVVADGLNTQRRELLQTIDARVLGIHETVRDLAAGERG